MPANLTPQFIKARERFHKAKEPEKKNNAEASSAASTLAKSRKVKLTGKKAAK